MIYIVGKSKKHAEAWIKLQNITRGVSIISTEVDIRGTPMLHSGIIRLPGWRHGKSAKTIQHIEALTIALESSAPNGDAFSVYSMLVRGFDNLKSTGKNTDGQ